MSIEFTKRIADPVHGTIGLSALEVRVISSAAFQRLRQVKQLGLAYLVFPGADYSRFAHSLGVCHVTGLLLEALQREQSSQPLTTADVQLYRLAALLHDVGHYPFSHTMEQALDNYASSSLLRPVDSGQAASSRMNEQDKTTFRAIYHESVGKEILEIDKELREIIKPFVEPRRVSAIFLREEPSPMSNLVSSDLDADRIDYLLRTSHHTGLPYGSVDLRYLISQMRIDGNGRICLRSQAMRTVDHFLLSRFFDYQQVSFHKTVASLELLLKDVIGQLIARNMIECDAESIKASIANQGWLRFDDQSVMNVIHSFSQSLQAGDPWQLKTQALTRRVPPKLVYEQEHIARRGKQETQRFSVTRRLLKEKISQWAQEFGIDESLWYVWEPSAMVLTKIGSNAPVSSMVERSDDQSDKYAQGVRILNRHGSSTPLVDMPSSLMSLLADSALFAVRIYVLFPPGEERQRESIKERIGQVFD